MKLIIAGGREYHLTNDDFRKLDTIPNVVEVVSGGAAGADYWGEYWAYHSHIPTKVFRADWKTHGKSAGPIRNLEMARYADAVALFPGGRGTENMFETAKKLNLTIYDFR